MKSTTNIFNSGWFAANISLSNEDIDKLIANLESLKNNESEHFHFVCTDFNAKDNRLADIQFFKAIQGESDNMTIEY